jgi:hypothetical protein
VWIFIIFRGVKHVEAIIARAAAPDDDQCDDRGNRKGETSDDDPNHDRGDMGAIGPRGPTTTVGW